MTRMSSRALCTFVCLGDGTWDVFGDWQRGRAQLYPGGAACNIATVLSRAGFAATVIGRVGDDDPGSELLARLAKDGVDIGGLRRDGRTDLGLVGRRFVPYCVSSRATVRSHTSLQPAFAPGGSTSTPTTLILGTDAVRTPMHARETQRFLKRFLHASSTQFSTTEKQASRRPQDTLPRIVVDLNFHPGLWQRPAHEPVLGLIKHADWIKASEEDLARLALEVGTLQRIAPHAICLLTRSCGGAVLHRSSGELRVKAFATIDGTLVEERDPTGAGDAFLAGVLAAKAYGATWARALRIGAHLGALAVTKQGATTAITPQAIRRALDGETLTPRRTADHCVR
jgi:sugar/nucleoside kinase (ribokinase family)